MYTFYLGGLKITSVGLASLLFSMFTTPAFALDRDANYGRTFSWSPYIDSIDIRPSNYYLFSKCYFHFDSTGANMNNSIWYFTIEQNNRIKDGLAMYSQFSNIPDPHFGYEDDNGDGYDEESEVSIEADLYKDQLVANTNYYFTTMWMNTKGVDHPGGTVQYIAQRSAYNPIRLILNMKLLTMIT